MTESQFILKNKKDWRELEFLLERKIKNPDKLNKLFIKVSSDLSYARTFYPNRSVRLYLNNLTQQIFDTLRTNKKNSSLKALKGFFSEKIPYEVFRSRNAFFSSLIVFVIAVCIGVISSANNPNFPNVILGNEYIEMTEANIRNGDPMAVYKDEREESMFLFITTNNVKVAFLAFIFGILGSIGTYIILLSNGIMLGAFQYFFYSKGLFLTSFLTIWIHGTIEISAIIIAGAAGIILGNGLLFPKSYTRVKSLQIASLKAIRIMVGVVPLFIIAGMLESYVTRHTEFSTVTKSGIIICSLLFILLQWVIHPIIYRYKNKALDVDQGDAYFKEEVLDLNKNKLRSFIEILIASIAHYRINLGKIFNKIITWPTLIFGIFLYAILAIYFPINNPIERTTLFNFEFGGYFYFLLTVILLTINIITVKLIFDKEKLSKENYIVAIKNYGAPIFVILTLYTLVYFTFAWYFLFLFFIVLPPHIIIILTEEEKPTAYLSSFKSFISPWKKTMESLLSYVTSYVIIFCLFGLLLVLFVSGVTQYLVSFISWHQLFEYQMADLVFVDQIFAWLLFNLSIPFCFILLGYTYHSEKCKTNALDLNLRIKQFGSLSPIFEKY